MYCLRYWARSVRTGEKEPLKIIIDLKEVKTRIKITIRTKDPFHKINLIDYVLSVARVGILLDFANFRIVNLSRRLT